MNISIDSIPIIVAVIDDQSNFIYFNKFLTDQNELFLKLQQENIKKDLKNIISDNQKDLNIVIDNKIVNYNLKTIKIEDNTIIFLNKTADNYLYKFISNISYNMRTELTGIFGNIFLLFETKLTKEQYSYLNNIKESSHELIKMINDVIDFLKLNNGSISLNKQKMSIKECFNFTKKIMVVPFKNNNIELTIRIDDYVPEWIVSDGERIKQLLVNLLYNSIKSYKCSGWIHIDVYYKDFDLIIKIKDGRKKEDSEYINEFFMKNNIKSNSESKIDFELLLSKYLITLFQGDIYIDDFNILNIKIPINIYDENKKQINNQNIGLYKIDNIQLKTDIYIFLLDNNLIPIFFSSLEELNLFINKKQLKYIITNKDFFEELKNLNISVYDTKGNFKKDLKDFIDS